tara:strand:- start:915 stop:2051 length:1137 start_codon:yes stop_codon:yes gene_type:complete
MYQFNNIFIESEISKKVLKSILDNTPIDFKKLKIQDYKKQILQLKKNYENKKKTRIKKLDYKYQIFWNIVEEKYNKRIDIVKRHQNKKNKNFNVIYSDFANILGFLPSLLTLLIFDKEIKSLIKYENLFKDLQKSGDFDHISFFQKISFIKKIQDNKVSIITPLCPDYEHVHIGLGLYKYTFNSLNGGLGLIGKRLVKIIKDIHRVLNKYKISFVHHAYYGDFEAFSKDICKRVKSTEKDFINKLHMSKKNLKKTVKEINEVDLLVNSLSSKKDWKERCKKNEKYILNLINTKKSFKKTINEILSSRMDLYKSWYPELEENEYLNLLVQQGAEYTTMGELFLKKIDNPIIFGLDHPKMGIFYTLKNEITVLYGKPKYV